MKMCFSKLAMLKAYQCQQFWTAKAINMEEFTVGNFMIGDDFLSLDQPF